MTWNLTGHVKCPDLTENGSQWDGERLPFLISMFKWFRVLLWIIAFEGPKTVSGDLEAIATVHTSSIVFTTSGYFNDWFTWLSMFAPLGPHNTADIGLYVREAMCPKVWKGRMPEFKGLPSCRLGDCLSCGWPSNLLRVLWSSAVFYTGHGVCVA